MKKLWLIPLLLMLSGCAKKVSVHPGAISNLDSYSYDILIVEQDAINNARNQAVQLSGTLANQMATTGMQAGSQAAQALNVSGTIYEQLMNTTIQQDTALQNAIAAFAGQAAIAGAISTGQKKAA